MKYFLGTIFWTLVFMSFYLITLVVAAFSFLWHGNSKRFKEGFSQKDRASFLIMWKGLYDWKDPNWPNIV